MRQTSSPCLLLVLGVLCVLSSGCGLIPFPRTRTLPDPVYALEICDRETEERLLDAQVICFFTRVENWANTFPPFAKDEFLTPADMPLLEHSELTLFPSADGTFGIESVQVTAYIKPVGITPLGSTIFDDYTVTISVDVAGYHPLSITYYPKNAPVGERVWEDGSKTWLTDDGLLRFYLLLDSSRD